MVMVVVLFSNATGWFWPASCRWSQCFIQMVVVLPSYATGPFWPAS
jgi:hypothetical protein